MEEGSGFEMTTDSWGSPKHIGHPPHTQQRMQQRKGNYTGSTIKCGTPQAYVFLSYGKSLVPYGESWSPRPHHFEPWEGGREGGREGGVN